MADLFLYTVMNWPVFHHDLLTISKHGGTHVSDGFSCRFVARLVRDGFAVGLELWKEGADFCGRE